jgi:hypothetical protein
VDLLASPRLFISVGVTNAVFHLLAYRNLVARLRSDAVIERASQTNGD